MKDRRKIENHVIVRLHKIGVKDKTTKAGKGKTCQDVSHKGTMIRTMGNSFL